MMSTFTKKSLACVALAALAACNSSGAASAPSNALPNAPAAQLARTAHTVNPLFANIVGVGDSLTAGYQAGGFLGALNVPNPLSPGSTVPPGQESGWWADLYEQATQTLPKQMYDPAVSPLPLIAAPGLDNQVVSSATTVIGELKSGDACTDYGGFNQSGFSLAGLDRVRMNPASTRVRDLGVPGITLHEALYMNQPLTPTCQPLPPTIPPAFGLLSLVVNGESGLFYPVLGSYAKQIPPSQFTMTNIAAQLQPSLATVWLGANDVLKYMGSGGQFVGGDMTPGQAQNDVSTIVTAVRKVTNHQTKVVVLNLPNVLLTPYFMNTVIPRNPASCNIHQYFYCLLTEFGVSNQQAVAITKGISAKYGLSPSGGRCVPGSVASPCGYVTLQGALAVIAALLAGKPVPNLDPSGPGSGLGGHYITPGFAAKIQTVNNNINQGINQAAAQTGATLVDVTTIFDGVASGDPHNKWFRLAQVNPGVCCTLVFLGGLVSYDGLHPSNTGYGLIAYAVIEAINAAYGTHVPEVPLKKIYAGLPPYLIPDPYAPQVAHDLIPVSNGHGGLELQRLRSF